jgi:uncharacterized YceG family protein
MAEYHERTAEEREAARLERERRRQQAEAGSEPDPSPSPPPPHLPSPGGSLEPSLPPMRTDEHERFDDAEPEEAAGTRRVGWREARGRRRHGGLRPPRPPRDPSRHRRFGAPHSWVGRGFAVLALLLAVALIWFLFELFQPLHGSGHGEITVLVPPHASTSQIADELDRDEVISSSFFFRLRASLSGDKLLPGTYHLRLGMSYGDVLKVLSTPPPAAKTTEVTIDPGRTRVQVYHLLKSQGIKGSYLVATRHSPLLDPAKYGAPKRTPDLEGFLWPDTYQLRVPIDVNALVADQLNAFKQRFRRAGMGWANAHHYTPYQVLIVASMVEAEAETEHDRPLIASVIYNRLAQGMPLQIDATVRYAAFNYTSPITESQLHSPSPWNTYVHKGLPPTPIGNPGPEAIAAAAHPAATNYLFFVVKPCGNGSHAFASSYAQFLLQEQQYQQARTRRGGHSPAHC